MESTVKKIAGVTLDQVEENFCMLVRWSNGERIVLHGMKEYDEYMERCREDGETDDRYIKDIDDLAHDRQPEILKPFLAEVEKIEKEHGWMDFDALFERFGA